MTWFLLGLAVGTVWMLVAVAVASAFAAWFRRRRRVEAEAFEAWASGERRLGA